MVNSESPGKYSKEKGGKRNEPDEYQSSPESEIEMENEFADQEDDLHICKGYVQPETLPLNQLTIKRAQNVGIGVPLLKFSEETFWKAYITCE